MLRPRDSTGADRSFFSAFRGVAGGASSSASAAASSSIVCSTGSGGAVSGGSSSFPHRSCWLSTPVTDLELFSM